MEDKNYVCDKCSPVKAFFDKFAYNDHMNIHLGMKPHVCKRGCRDVAYANASTLHAHYRYGRNFIWFYLITGRKGKE